MLREAEGLAASCPYTSKVRDEIAALQVLHAAFPTPGKNEIQMGRDCVERIRSIAATLAQSASQTRPTSR